MGVGVGAEGGGERGAPAQSYERLFEVMKEACGGDTAVVLRCAGCRYAYELSVWTPILHARNLDGLRRCRCATAAVRRAEGMGGG